MLRSFEYFDLPGLTSFHPMFTSMTFEAQCRHRADSISATRVIWRNAMQTLNLAMAGHVRCRTPICYGSIRIPYA